MEFSHEEYKYFDYIVEHKKNVMRAFDIMSGPLLGLKYTNPKGDVKTVSDITIAKLRKIVLTHDVSKFASIEFEAYREKFYPTDEESQKQTESKFHADLVNTNFEFACKHHFEKNPHHLEYWVGMNESITQSALSALELVLDRVAMSLKFANDPYDYYCNQKPRLEARIGDSKVQWDLIERGLQLASETLKRNATPE